MKNARRRRGRFGRRLAFVLIGVMAACVAWLLLEPARDYALTNICEPAGIVAKLRAFTRPRAFWESQALAADARIAYLSRRPPDLPDVDAKLVEILRNSEASMERVYQAHPEMRPSTASVAAQALRNQADRIEREETLTIIATMIEKEVARIAACKPIAAARATER